MAELSSKAQTSKANAFSNFMNLFVKQKAKNDENQPSTSARGTHK